MKTVFAGIGSLAYVAIAAQLQAQFVTNSASLSGPVSVIDFSALGASQSPLIATANPASFVQVGAPVGADVRMSYMVGTQGLFSGYSGWGLPPNGNWSRPSIGINQSGVVRYWFNGGAVSGVGVLMNYAPCCAGPSVFVRSLDVNGNVINEVNLLTTAPIAGQATNEGQFRGFQYGSAQVWGFEVGNTGGSPSPIMTNLTFTSSSTVVPEPASFALVVVGLLGIGVASRKRRLAA